MDKQPPAQDRPDYHDDAQKYEHSVAPHVRRLRLRALRDRLRESQLFLPAVMLLMSVSFGIVLIELEQAGVTRNLPRVFARLTPDVTISLLSTIAGAMITTAGVVFSILVVSLQLATGQFSPRVLRGFWRDRSTQVLIGLLLSTFAFSVLALTSIDPISGPPHYMVSGSILLTMASVAAIVVYLDRVSRQQYVGRIMERVVDETLVLVSELPYGPRIGTRVGDPVPPPDLARLGPPFVVLAPRDGWVQQVSRHALMAAVPPGSVVRLETRVGEYLTRDTPLATIWPLPAAEDRTQIARLVAEALIVGRARTMQQDIEFGVRQLVDIGLRAASPAVIDETTAIEAVLRLGSVMRPLLVADLPAQCVRDGDGPVLLTPSDLDHGEYVRQAFNQLRYYSENAPQVQRNVLRTLRMLRTAVANQAGRDQARAELDRQIELVLAGLAKAGLLPGDRELVEAALH